MTDPVFGVSCLSSAVPSKHMGTEQEAAGGEEQEAAGGEGATPIQSQGAPGMF